MLRFLRYIIEFVAAFVGFVILLVLLLAWRLSANPVSADFLTPYIEEGVENLVPDSDVHVASTLMTWNNIDRSISMHAEDIRIADARGGEIADIPSLDASISVLGLLFGQFLPKDLAIDRPQIRLDRNASGAFVFGGMAVSDGDNAAAQSKPQPPIRTVLKQITEHLSHAALMHRLAVTGAMFDVHDDVTQKDWTVSVPEISIARAGIGASGHRLDYGALDGRMSVEVTQRDAIATLDVHYAFDPTTQRHSLSTVFNGLDPAFLAGGHPETLGLGLAAIADLPLTGKAQVSFDKNLDIAAAQAHIHGDAGQLRYGDFWDQPCPVTSIDMQADYDRDAHHLAITDTHIDFDGPTLDLTVDGAAAAQPGQDLDYTAVIQVEHMPMNRFGALWPKPVLPDPREWMAANLHDGEFPHADITLRGSLAWNDLDHFSVSDGGGKVLASGAKVTYLDGMPPAIHVDAEATFDLKQMTVRVTGGGVGNIRMLPFTMQVTGLADTDQYAAIPLQVAGSIPDMLNLLNSPRLGYAKALGIAPDDITGTAQGAINFRFPLLKTVEMKDVDLHATATAANVASTRLIPGIAIANSNLGMTLDMSGFNLKGQADLDKIPFQITWRQNFDHKPGQPLQQATLAGAIRDDQWDGLGIDLFRGSKGAVNVSLDMTRPAKNKMLVSGTLDMTPAAMQVDRLGWTKPAGAAAILKFSADAPAGQPVNVTDIDLRGDHVMGAGSAVLSADMKDILSLDLSRLAIGRTDAAIQFSQSLGDAGTVRLDVTGAALDVAGLRSGDHPQPPSNDPRRQEYRIDVEHLYSGVGGEIDQAKGFATRDAEGWSAIDLRGMVGGDKPLVMQLTPQPDGHLTLAISCDDFGEAIKGLGFTDTVKGGKLSVTGQSAADNPRLIEGRARITSFTVNNLPALALLLNATSPFGFGGILTDSADFSRFEGDFRWQDRQLTLIRAHAAGSAIGINIDGKVNMDSGDANLQGTLVPFSVMNNMLNYIPIIGGLITGGQDQGVLAVSYTIKGSLNAPDISVNPVSLLTPGFLRNLFFRDDTEQPPDK